MTNSETDHLLRASILVDWLRQRNNHKSYKVKFVIKSYVPLSMYGSFVVVLWHYKTWRTSLDVFKIRIKSNRYQSPFCFVMAKQLLCFTNSSTGNVVIIHVDKLIEWRCKHSVDVQATSSLSLNSFCCWTRCFTPF